MVSVTVGLSPRERGNLPHPRYACVAPGSIPARAGEPAAIPGRRPVGRVYPRASGGTGSSVRFDDNLIGLSPRERGNRRRWQVRDRYRGSIPARAGEPAATPASAWISRVYPRASGGTTLLDNIAAGDRGLSPRERGNRSASARPRPRTRSIPARAGEPWRRRRSSSGPAVYPRASGGTPTGHCRRGPRRGLSPRERGNRRGSAYPVRRRGSIPARAGEPSRVRVSRPPERVYPRASGGT